MSLRALAPLTVAALGGLSSAAYADLPEIVGYKVFEDFCSEIKTSSECPDCTCTAVSASSPDASTVGAQPDLTHAILVKLENTVTHETPYRLRYFVALGSDAKLVNGGELHRLDSTTERPSSAELVVNKSQQFNDVCATCDHPGVGLVHLFDLDLRESVMWFDEEGVPHEEHTTAGMLLTCFGRETPTCYATPLAMTSQKNRPPQAPGDKDAKQGKKESVKRTWKIGGRDKMQIVLSPFTGNMAKSIEGTPLVTEPREFHFGDLPSRQSSFQTKR